MPEGSCDVPCVVCALSCDDMFCVTLQAAVERVEKQMDKMGDLATDHRAVQVSDMTRHASGAQQSDKIDWL